MAETSEKKGVTYADPASPMSPRSPSVEEKKHGEEMTWIHEYFQLDPRTAPLIIGLFLVLSCLPASWEFSFFRCGRVSRESRLRQSSSDSSR